MSARTLVRSGEYYGAVYLVGGVSDGLHRLLAAHVQLHPEAGEDDSVSAPHSLFHYPGYDLR
jgi:hypothetical protein